jgi:branched-chain amino acid aminotransferase
MIDKFPAWKNGKFCKVKDLNISILDLGLIHCDATYDVISIRNKKPFLLKDHLERFFASARHWRIDIDYKVSEIKKVIKELYLSCQEKDLLIWIVATRGIPESGSPRDLKNCKSNLMMYTKPYFGFNSDNTASVCFAKTLRVPNESIDQKFKNFAWNDLTMAQWEAIDEGYDTAVLFDKDGYLTEGPGFSLFAIKDDMVITPDNNCLGSITIKAIEKICHEENIVFMKGKITKENILNCDAVCLASTAGNIIEVSRLENIIYLEKNPLVGFLQEKFNERIANKKWSTNN